MTISLSKALSSLLDYH